MPSSRLGLALYPLRDLYFLNNRFCRIVIEFGRWFSSILSAVKIQTTWNILAVISQYKKHIKTSNFKDKIEHSFKIYKGEIQSLDTYIKDMQNNHRMSSAWSMRIDIILSMWGLIDCKVETGKKYFTKQLNIAPSNFHRNELRRTTCYLAKQVTK